MVNAATFQVPEVRGGGATGGGAGRGRPSGCHPPSVESGGCLLRPAAPWARPAGAAGRGRVGRVAPRPGEAGRQGVFEAPSRRPIRSSEISPGASHTRSERASVEAWGEWCWDPGTGHGDPTCWQLGPGRGQGAGAVLGARPHSEGSGGPEQGLDFPRAGAMGRTTGAPRAERWALSGQGSIVFDPSREAAQVKLATSHRAFTHTSWGRMGVSADTGRGHGAPLWRLGG